jgi:hypothetical protein
MNPTMLSTSSSDSSTSGMTGGYPLAMSAFGERMDRVRYSSSTRSSRSFPLVITTLGEPYAP